MSIVESVKMIPVGEMYINFTFILLLLAIWAISVLVIIAARRVRKDDKAIVPENDPPQNISPVFARYIITSGRMGGVSGEVSVTGVQLLTMINLFEDGLLKECSFVDENTVRYVVNENYKQMRCTVDEMIFLDQISEKIGMSGTLKETLSKNNGGGSGYDQLGRIWLEFWGNTLNKLAVDGGYMKKRNGLGAVFLQWFSVSLTFGMFFSVFILFIPIIGPVVAALVVLPILLVFGICVGVVIIATKILPITVLSIIGAVPTVAIFVALFVSWFAWWLIYGQNVTKLVLRLTPAGLELVRKIRGYKMYLKTVDLNRLSFEFNRDNDFNRNRTTFSWLGIFSLAKDLHWDQWYSLSKYKEQSDISVPEISK